MIDLETGNDDFGARYYSNRFGRWLSSDWSATPVPVPYANLTNPQTLNLYAMVSDDPESFADLDGHCDWCQKLKNLALSRGWQTDNEYKEQVAWYNSLSPGERKIVDRHLQQATEVVYGMGATTILGLAYEPSGGNSENTNSTTETTSSNETVSAEERELANRAQQIQSALPEGTQGCVTTAVGTAVNTDGTTSTLVSTSEGTLRPAQRAALQPGETAVQGQPRTHAEVNMLNHANANGQTLQKVAPSRPACATCRQQMQNNNVKIIPPTKKPGT